MALIDERTVSLGGRRHFCGNDEAIYFPGVRFAPTDIEKVAYAEFKEKYPDVDQVVHCYPKFVSEIDPETEVRVDCAWKHPSQGAYYFLAQKIMEKEKHVTRKLQEMIDLKDGTKGSILVSKNVLHGQKLKVTLRQWKGWHLDEVQQYGDEKPTVYWVFFTAINIADLHASPKLVFSPPPPPRDDRHQTTTIIQHASPRRASSPPPPPRDDMHETTTIIQHASPQRASSPPPPPPPRDDMHETTTIIPHVSPRLALSPPPPPHDDMHQTGVEGGGGGGDDGVVGGSVNDLEVPLVFSIGNYMRDEDLTLPIYNGNYLRDEDLPLQFNTGNYLRDEDLPLNPDDVTDWIAAFGLTRHAEGGSHEV